MPEGKKPSVRPSYQPFPLLVFFFLIFFLIYLIILCSYMFCLHVCLRTTCTPGARGGGEPQVHVGN